MSKVITCGRAAKLCGFSAKVIRNLCDRGLVKSHRLPPPVRPDRKIDIRSLIDYLTANGCPVSSELEALANPVE